jgi:hypothetical protein
VNLVDDDEGSVGLAAELVLGVDEQESLLRAVFLAEAKELERELLGRSRVAFSPRSFGRNSSGRS